MNKVFLMGNLVKDPETRAASGNGSFTTFCIAVNDGFGEKKKVYFIECAAGGKCGENIAKFFHKGKQILIEGKLYVAKNKNSGFDELRLSVFGFDFTSDGSNSGGGNNGGGGQNNNRNSNNNNDSRNGYNNNNSNNGGNNQNQGNNQGGGHGNNQEPVDDIPF